jgi:DMSO/TMAO reductase YedYZ molybdopterin-dependent catalytic subunit
MKAEMPCIHDEPLPPWPAGSFRVSGRVKAPLVVSMENLRGMESEELKDLPIYCGTGTPKGIIGRCRGVLLENVIRRAEVIRDGHDDTKKMFVVAIAADGYKAVFSWQEIFNTPIGGGIMILIERDGRPLDGKNGGPELISAEDYYTGSRYIKRLKDIQVLMVE